MPGTHISRRRTATALVVLLAALALIAAAFLIWRQPEPALAASAPPTPSATATATDQPTVQPTEPPAPSVPATDRPPEQPTSSAPATEPAEEPTGVPTGQSSEAPPPEPDPTSARTGKQGVHPIVTFAGFNASAGRVEVSGFVNSVLEQGGTCTAVLTRGSEKVSASRSAQPSATTTDCGNIAIATSRLSAGAWRAVLTYESADSFGSTAATTIEVP